MIIDLLVALVAARETYGVTGRTFVSQTDEDSLDLQSRRLSFQGFFVPIAVKPAPAYLKLSHRAGGIYGMCSN